MAMDERLKQLRKTLGITQQEFADKISIKRNTYAQYETGRNEPIDAVVALICEKFNVDEKWLRAGEGEMFVKKTEDEEREHFRTLIDRMLSDSDEKFRRALLEVILRMDARQVAAVKEYAVRYLLPAVEGEAAGAIEADGGEAFAEESGQAAAGQKSQPKHAGGAFAIDGATAAAGSESRPDQADAAFDDYEPTIEEKVEAYRQALLEEEALKKAGEAV